MKRDRQSKTIRFRVTAREYKRVENLVRFYGLTASELVRQLLWSAYKTAFAQRVKGKHHGKGKAVLGTEVRQESE